MKFKIGDKIRFKVTEEEWESYFVKENINDDRDGNDRIRSDIIAFANNYKDLFGEVITVSIIVDDDIHLLINNKTGPFKTEAFCEDWFLPYEEESEDVIDENGFKTNPKNWDNGLGLL